MKKLDYSIIGPNGQEYVIIEKNYYESLLKRKSTSTVEPFGKRLKAIRLAAGITVEELAIECEIEQPNLTNIENTDRKPWVKNQENILAAVERIKRRRNR